MHTVQSWVNSWMKGIALLLRELNEERYAAEGLKPKHVGPTHSMQTEIRGPEDREYPADLESVR